MQRSPPAYLSASARGFAQMSKHCQLKMHKDDKLGSPVTHETPTVGSRLLMVVLLRQKTFIFSPPIPTTSSQGNQLLRACRSPQLTIRMGARLRVGKLMMCGKCGAGFDTPTAEGVNLIPNGTDWGLRRGGMNHTIGLLQNSPKNFWGSGRKQMMLSQRLQQSAACGKKLEGVLGRKARATKSGWLPDGACTAEQSLDTKAYLANFSSTLWISSCIQFGGLNSLEGPNLMMPDVLALRFASWLGYCPSPLSKAQQAVDSQSAQKA